MLDLASIDCDPSLARPGSENSPAAEFLNTSCAKSFCHGRSFVASLDLRPDEGFAQRLLDAPALFGGIPCPDDITQECVPASCPAPGTALLIDSADPTASWILTKAHNEQGDCGDRATCGTALTPAQDACLIAIVNATAALK